MAYVPNLSQGSAVVSTINTFPYKEIVMCYSKLHLAGLWWVYQFLAGNMSPPGATPKDSLVNLYLHQLCSCGTHLLVWEICHLIFTLLFPDIGV